MRSKHIKLCARQNLSNQPSQRSANPTFIEIIRIKYYVRPKIVFGTSEILRFKTSLIMLFYVFVLLPYQRKAATHVYTLQQKSRDGNFKG
jgi:hypothetical protein